VAAVCIPELGAGRAAANDAPPAARTPGRPLASSSVANAIGWAAITLPLGEVEGLPVGVQMLALDETILLRLSAQLEQALPWAHRHPPGYAHETDRTTAQ
jgi:Asp-tRNA(Asn)/Glu-tRNA(Gln) amidotransferase A subunit family amidase